MEENKNKQWYQIINFYKLTGLVLIWVSSWLFMTPFLIETNGLVFQNIWGKLLSFIGIVSKENVVVQQKPDLFCGIFSLLFIIILQLRGIFSVIDEKKDIYQKKSYELLFILLNVLSIIIHTLYFSLIIKIFVFPELNQSFVSRDIYRNLVFIIFLACSVTAIILSVQSVAKLVMILLLVFCIVKNISVVSDILGVYGFVAILLSAIGFYLEIYSEGINKQKLLIDIKLLACNYDLLIDSSKEEMLKFNKTNKKHLFKISNKKK